MNILIAPNSFKNSLDSGPAARAIEKGLQQSGFTCTTICSPVGDGGDGTGVLLTELCKGETVTMQATGPLGKEVTASFGLIDKGKTAIIELASASGLRLLQHDELDPMHATSFGTGMLARAALEKGATKIIFCVGGSATVDGGCGILEALGVQFLDDRSRPLVDLPADLPKLSSIDISALHSKCSECEWVVLCDVTNPLLGDNGAAPMFGPQKGASDEDIEELEKGLAQFAGVVEKIKSTDIRSVPHGGAAGGTAAGLYGILNAKLVNGIDHFLDTVSFTTALEKADIVITGEGSLDLQTLGGKAPYGVAMKAKAKNIPVIALAGKISWKDQEQLHRHFDVMLTIGNGVTDKKTALLNTEEDLIRAGMELGKLLSLKSKI